MTLAKLLSSLTRLRRIQPKVGALHASIVRLTGGRIKRSRLLAAGQPVLVLSTTGRRSGVRRSTVVAYVPLGESYAVSALNLGSGRDPAWCLNLRSDPRASVYLAGEERAVRGREATGAEAERLWEAFFRRLPATANSRRVARRDVPMVVLDPVAD